MIQLGPGNETAARETAEIIADLRDDADSDNLEVEEIDDLINQLAPNTPPEVIDQVEEIIEQESEETRESEIPEESQNQIRDAMDNPDTEEAVDDVVQIINVR